MRGVPVSYSQQDEEEHILRACPVRGRFLDIGAWDPRRFSNTRALFERGWSGVMIEPSPQPMLTLLAEYGQEPRITLVQAAVGLEPGLIDMRITADAVSTSDPSVYELWKDAGGYVGRMFVPRITLADIFERWDDGFGFVNIDAEGLSGDLCLELLRWAPRCLCVEHDGRPEELAARVIAAGYEMPYRNDTNCLFVVST